MGNGTQLVLEIRHNLGAVLGSNICIGVSCICPGLHGIQCLYYIFIRTRIAPSIFPHLSAIHTKPVHHVGIRLYRSRKKSQRILFRPSKLLCQRRQYFFLEI